MRRGACSWSLSPMVRGPTSESSGSCELGHTPTPCAPPGQAPLSLSVTRGSAPFLSYGRSNGGRGREAGVGRPIGLFFAAGRGPRLAKRHSAPTGQACAYTHTHTNWAPPALGWARQHSGRDAPAWAASRRFRAASARIREPRSTKFRLRSTRFGLPSANLC